MTVTVVLPQFLRLGIPPRSAGLTAPGSALRVSPLSRPLVELLQLPAPPFAAAQALEGDGVGARVSEGSLA